MKLSITFNIRALLTVNIQKVDMWPKTSLYSYTGYAKALQDVEVFIKGNKTR